MFGNNSNGNRKSVDRIWLSTADEIATAIGRERHDIPRLVKDEGLPAFKFYGKWTALSEDMILWSRKMAKKYHRNRAGPGPELKGRRKK
jgi:hypothetical protein